MKKAGLDPLFSYRARGASRHQAFFTTSPTTAMVPAW
jgi:hypothetical protein